MNAKRRFVGHRPPLQKIVGHPDGTGSQPRSTQDKARHLLHGRADDQQSQANAKTTLKVATQTNNDTVAQRYPEFSSVIDLLRGAVGNNTALGKQLTNIRKQAAGSRARAAGNVIEVNTGAKKAA